MSVRPFRALVGAFFIVTGLLLLFGGPGSALLTREYVVSGVVALFGLASLVGFAFSRRWWLLPLGCALVTVAALQVLYSAGLDQFLTVTGLSLVGLGGPFVGLYLHNHRGWGWLVPGYLLWAAGGTLFLLGLLLVGVPLSADWLATLGLWLLALLFVVIFAGNRRAWWAFGPAFVLWAAGAALRLLEGPLAVEGLATWGLWALALPVWFSYLRDDSHVWRLLLAGGFTLAGALPLFLTPQLGFWLAIGVSAGVATAWLAAWLRRREPPLPEKLPKNSV